jgi:hypothetical protein
MPLKWRKVWISDERYESAAVCDVNGDGHLDIISGAFWYEGPDFRRKHVIGDIAQHGEYYDDFSTVLVDINGNGRLDYVTGGWWGSSLRWREHPADPTQPWPEHLLWDNTGNVETTRGWDIDGDGIIEIIPNTPPNPTVSYYKLRTDASGRGTGAFDQIPIYTFADGTQGHGLGCGDIAGNGRMDIVLCHGWLEAPADPMHGTWIWHPEFINPPWGTTASIPMLVVDVDGDGHNELITGHAHGYGLWWSKRRADGTWHHHPIDPDNAQYHDLHWVDIDGDGHHELVTGKRHRAHNGNDPGEWDDVGIYYFKWSGESFVKQVVNYGPIGIGKGCGIHFAIADIYQRGRLDIVAPGKDGLYLFVNQGSTQ